MYPLAEPHFFPCPEYSGISCDPFEPLISQQSRVFEPIDQIHLPAKRLRASLAQSVTALRTSGYGEGTFLMAASS